MRAAAASELAEQSLGPATKFALLPDPFPFWRGGTLSGGRVAYETWGELNEARDNALLLFTGLSPSAHAASSPQDPSPGRWEKMVGPGKAIDTNRYFVICVNSLGSCFGSSGPASIDPSSLLQKLAPIGLMIVTSGIDSRCVASVPTTARASRRSRCTGARICRGSSRPA